MGRDPEDSGLNVVQEAQDGVEAVEKTRTLLPDVVLMDVSMPRMGGVEATRQIKREFPHIGIVALTMYEEQQYIFDWFAPERPAILKKTPSLPKSSPPFERSIAANP
ncbi:MAG: response regulator transcription factor [Nitrospiraceae bacterium]